ncbi:hypothetical protein L915_19354 [Phytophthora nicotianae]|uniref:Uncharacterized protein n=1 Tax=Phytophthora nicotianae TaxID=4792 RepID=W2FSJ8_PHYNI|nr:hypothetical protein L915_19354 [Phytophthora nicotianae]
MFAWELEGLKRLKIEAIRWGSSYRVKVRGKTGKIVYVSNLSRPSDRKLVAKQYGISEDKLSTHLSSDYKADPKYRFYSGNHMETHIYENIQPGEFYDKLENVLNCQQKASKVNIAIGYILISKSDHTDESYFYPNTANASVFDKPVAINSKGDIRKKIISEIRAMELADRLKYTKSGYQRKAIVGFKICIYHRAMLSPPDILQFDDLEEYFKLAINVYTHDIESGKTERIRQLENNYDTINILSHEKHALYIKDIDMFLSKYQCPKLSICDSITEEERCFVDNQPRELLAKMFVYIKSIVAKVFKYNIVKYETLIRKIIEAHGLTGMDIPGAPLGTTYKLKDINQWIEEGKYSSFFDFCDQVSGTRKTDYGKLMQLLKQVPVLGFNSGKYDINLIKNDLFSALGTDNTVSVIKNPNYMCIAANDMKMLDISNYVPAGTSYSKYLSTYFGGCQCDDKIRWVCGLGKGIFCYEYITDFSVLSRTQIPPQSVFDSKLTGTKISHEDYERVKFVWEHCNMKSIMDLLIWYNDLDVKPFVKAQRELFKRFDLDMFADGVSFPGLSEKVMYQTCFSKLTKPSRKPAASFNFPEHRYLGYIEQDKKADRQFAMTIKHLNELLQKQKYLCGLCYCQLSVETVSADRINNKLGHQDGNILISCTKCNCARKDMNLKAFRFQKLLRVLIKTYY